MMVKTEKCPECKKPSPFTVKSFNLDWFWCSPCKLEFSGKGLDKVFDRITFKGKKDR